MIDRLDKVPWNTKPDDAVYFTLETDRDYFIWYNSVGQIIGVKGNGQRISDVWQDDDPAEWDDTIIKYPVYWDGEMDSLEAGMACMIIGDTSVSGSKYVEGRIRYIDLHHCVWEDVDGRTHYNRPVWMRFKPYDFVSRAKDKWVNAAIDIAGKSNAECDVTFAGALYDALLTGELSVPKSTECERGS